MNTQLNSLPLPPLVSQPEQIHSNKRKAPTEETNFMRGRKRIKRTEKTDSPLECFFPSQTQIKTAILGKWYVYKMFAFTFAPLSTNPFNKKIRIIGAKHHLPLGKISQLNDLSWAPLEFIRKLRNLMDPNLSNTFDPLPSKQQRLFDLVSLEKQRQVISFDHQSSLQSSENYHFDEHKNGKIDEPITLSQPLSAPPTNANNETDPECWVFEFEAIPKTPIDPIDANNTFQPDFTQSLNELEIFYENPFEVNI